MVYVGFNGQLIDEKDAVVSVADKAYFFDFAVYSSLKVIQGKIFFAEYHVDRLLDSAARIDLVCQYGKQEILDLLNKVVSGNGLKDAFLRIVLIGDANENKNAKLYVFPLTGVHYYPDRFYKHGVKVTTYVGERRFPESKTKDLLLSFLAFREAERAEAIESLLVDNKGNIREGTRSNFFAIKGNNLIMPPAAQVLEGITKKIIIEVCTGKFNIVEEEIPLARVLAKEYDELFISSTLFNALPINQIDSTVFQSEFEKTRLVQRLFKEYYDKNVLGKTN
ncbi:MAG: aminotransferase class IV [archaeon]